MHLTTTTVLLCIYRKQPVDTQNCSLSSSMSLYIFLYFFVVVRLTMQTKNMTRIQFTTEQLNKHIHHTHEPCRYFLPTSIHDTHSMLNGMPHRLSTLSSIKSIYKFTIHSLHCLVHAQTHFIPLFNTLVHTWQQ